MSVVVTGVAGFIGSHLAARLLAQGEDVIGIDCLTDYYDVSLKRANLDGLLGHPRFRFERLDLAQDELPTTTSAMRPASTTWQPSPASGRAGATHSVRMSGTTSSPPSACWRRCVGRSARIVFASSSSVYGDAERYPTPEDPTPQPISPYGVTKLCSEQLVMAYRRSAGLDARCVRYFTVYGPRQRPDMAFSTVHRGGPTRRRRRGVSATVSRCATSRSSPTPWRRPFEPVPWRIPARRSSTSAVGQGLPCAECWRRSRRSLDRPIEIRELPAATR